MRLLEKLSQLFLKTSHFPARHLHLALRHSIFVLLLRSAIHSPPFHGFPTCLQFTSSYLLIDYSVQPTRLSPVCSLRGSLTSPFHNGGFLPIRLQTLDIRATQQLSPHFLYSFGQLRPHHLSTFASSLHADRSIMIVNSVSRISPLIIPLQLGPHSGDYSARTLSPLSLSLVPGRVFR